MSQFKGTSVCKSVSERITFQTAAPFNADSNCLQVRGTFSQLLVQAFKIQFTAQTGQTSTVYKADKANCHIVSPL